MPLMRTELRTAIRGIAYWLPPTIIYRAPRVNPLSAVQILLHKLRDGFVVTIELIAEILVIV